MFEGVGRGGGAIQPISGIRQDLSRTYLTHHELESVVIVIIIIISGISLGSCHPTICVNLCELTQDEFDLGSDWPRTGSSGTTPAGKSATGSSGRTGAAGGNSKQAGSSHQPGQTRDAQANAFGTAGNAAATGAPFFLLTPITML